jgi:hypothetical protein
MYVSPKPSKLTHEIILPPVPPSKIPHSHQQSTIMRTNLASYFALESTSLPPSDQPFIQHCTRQKCKLCYTYSLL